MQLVRGEFIDDRPEEHILQQLFVHIRLLLLWAQEKLTGGIFLVEI
jgi:hypothetical protein